jgi:hypothetical protein
MSRKFLLVAWLVSVLALSLAAGFSWVDIELSPAAGGQALAISGYTVFPIISALILLQGASLFASIFTPATVSKVIVALQIPIVIWHTYIVLTTVSSALQLAVSSEITRVTGVEGIESQSQLIELVLDNNVWIVYAAILLGNLALLLGLVVSKYKPSKSRSTDLDLPDAEDLWQSQS